MGRKKAVRIKEACGFDRILRDEVPKKSDWSDFFGTSSPLILEIGCGKGEYTLGLAQRHPENNYLGIDKKIYRLWFGAKAADEFGLQNVAFLNRNVEELPVIFDHHEISEIWITFPDPYPKDRHEERRLVNPHFIDIYQSILKPGGRIHLKTDNRALFNYAEQTAKEKNCRILAKTTNLYAEKNLASTCEIQTSYEKKYLSEGKDICYLSFSFTNQ